MGDTLSWIADQEWGEELKKMKNIFSKRLEYLNSNGRYQDLEESIALLFKELEQQQLNKRTWDLMNNVKKRLLGSLDEPLYYLSGYNFKQV